jgi:hypothetical protein
MVGGHFWLSEEPAPSLSNVHSSPPQVRLMGASGARSGAPQGHLKSAFSGTSGEPQGRDSYREGQSSSPAAPEAPSREVRPAGARVQPSWCLGVPIALQAATSGPPKGTSGEREGREGEPQGRDSAGRSTAGLAAPRPRPSRGSRPIGSEGTTRLVLVGSTHAPCGAQCRLRFPLRVASGVR